jgi:hypothetical protein
MDISPPPEPTPVAEQYSVIHLSKAARTSLATVLGGGEATKMTPELANKISVLDELLSCRMIPDE